MVRRKSPATVLLFSFLILFTASCATQWTRPIQPTPEEKFEASVNLLVNKVLAAEIHTPREMAPAAVMSGSLKSGSFYSRLEEYIMEQLKLRLREQREIYTFSRQNWFEYREGQPLVRFHGGFE
ncbi:MAG: hypothetical protein JRH18_21900 [Deltaproteobacteria bacterium]|nr:hypothetical protein [Deltaproteobacteria bacterium]MBW1963151.1 hypothetical protein [Deltaproteobacteria bacterium]MBW2154305.1 hypothetical protein [Deltaproteobacteria bacterium]